jgi:photosystem II stability/assembly factor-like uncharacterized protein
MKPFIYLAGITFLIFSCKKNDNNTGIGKGLPSNVDTTILNANLPEPLLSVFFTSPASGFVGGSNGGIYKTADSGKTWSPLQSTVNLPIYSLYFLNGQKGFAVGGQDFCGGTGCPIPGAFILETVDGGQTWAKVYTPTAKVELHSVCFVNASTGFCAGGDMIIKTSDGGQTWSEYKVNDLGGKLMQIAFTDAQKGYITSHAKIVETTDGGMTWRATSPLRNIGYYSIGASGGTLYVSGQGKMIKSTNDGTSWSELSNSPSDIYAVHFIDSKKGFAFGRGNYSGGDFGYSYGAIYFTNDGGASWAGSAEVKEVGLIGAVSFPTDGLGYGVSGNKIIRIKVI